MLKIKDLVDLKELEKFGYKKGIVYCFGECYVKELENDDFIFIKNDTTKYISFELSNVYLDEKNLIDDLIQAGLVEKIEE